MDLGLRAHALALQPSSADRSISSTTLLLAYDDQPLPAIIRHFRPAPAQPDRRQRHRRRPGLPSPLLVDGGRLRGDGSSYGVPYPPVLVTFLQRAHAHLPHYRGAVFTCPRGALSTRLRSLAAPSLISSQRRTSSTTTRGTSQVPPARTSLPLASRLHAAPGVWTTVIQIIRACKVGITLRVFIYRTCCGLTFFFTSVT